MPKKGVFTDSSLTKGVTVYGKCRRKSIPHHVVIIGGGFGGPLCSQSTRSGGVSVTLVDKRNFHLFQPPLPSRNVLYPADISSLSARF